MVALGCPPEKTVPPPGSHVFQRYRTILEFSSEIIRPNALMKISHKFNFYEDWTQNVTSTKTAMPLDILRNYAPTKKTAPSPGGHVFQQIATNFQLCQDILRTNSSFTRKTGCHVFPQTRNNFKLSQDFIRTNVVTKFHEDWIIHEASRVLTRIYYSHFIHIIIKTAPPPGSHVLQRTATMFKHAQDILRTNVLNKFHEDRTKNVISILQGTKFHVFQQTGTIFECG
ncbi:hypothetical protein DPMN_081430 [Dreissena polymorpha]|uniref:Uncharacterized protein n=1 Tax=Dreissena polymorpha TaxID=45954 RepID=A0A9D3Y7A3_DREPO|nr:hypothetical protein DPMN_081430 [Dreissena polymorpha]